MSTLSCDILGIPAPCAAQFDETVSHAGNSYRSESISGDSTSSTDSQSPKQSWLKRLGRTLLESLEAAGTASRCFALPYIASL